MTLYIFVSSVACVRLMFFFVFVVVAFYRSVVHPNQVRRGLLVCDHIRGHVPVLQPLLATTARHRRSPPPLAAAAAAAATTAAATATA